MEDIVGGRKRSCKMGHCRGGGVMGGGRHFKNEMLQGEALQQEVLKGGHWRSLKMRCYWVGITMGGIKK